MKKPTKVQRHAVYKKALSIFDANPMGLCLVIRDADGFRWAEWLSEVREYYPEFSLVHGPNEDYRSKKFRKGYDNDGNNKIRRKALLKCIKLTKPNTKP